MNAVIHTTRLSRRKVTVRAVILICGAGQPEALTKATQVSVDDTRSDSLSTPLTESPR